MKNILTLLLVLSSITSFGQSLDTSLFINNKNYGFRYKRYAIDSQLIIPRGDTSSKIASQIKTIGSDLWFTGIDNVWHKVAAGTTISGTINQLRALTTTTGSVYFSTDRTGTWIDKGLNDGVYVDDGILHIITANGHHLERDTSNATYAKWYTTGDSSINNTTALQSAISKGGNVYLTERYIVSNTITVPSNTHIIGLNGSSVTVANGTNKILFNVVDATNVSIEGLTLNGNIANQDKSGTDPLNLPEFWSGINMLNSQNVVIRNNIIKNFNGDGITVEGRYIVTGRTNVNKNVLISGNIISHSGRNAVSVIHGDGISIVGNTLYDQKAYTSTLGAGIDIEPNVGNGSEIWIAKNVDITGNIIYGNNEGIMLAGSPVISSQIFENIKIEGNSVYSNVSRNIYAFSLDATKFITGGVIISGNTLKGDSLLTNSTFFNSCHSDIQFTGNDLSNSITPILVYRSSNLNFIGNTIQEYGSSGGGSGIELFGSSYCNLKTNTIKNGNTNSSFLYGITLTSSDSVFKNQYNSIENNIITVTKAGKYMFAGLVGVSNDPAWSVIMNNKINGNNADGITAANFLFVNCKTTQNQIGINYTQATALIPDHSINTLVPYSFRGDRPTATTDLPITNNSEGDRRFDNIKGEPVWWNGTNWRTGVLEGYNFGQKEISKILTANFPGTTANQKIDILLPSDYFSGQLQVSVQSGFIGENAAGIVSKDFALGYNPGGTVYSNNSHYTEAIGEIIDNISISDLVWDATLSKYKITINHLKPTTNPVTVKVNAFSIDTGTTRRLYEETILGSVYTGTSSIADAAIEYKYPVRGVAATAPGHLVIKSQLDAKTAAANTNAVSPDATDLPSALTLINELKTVINLLQDKLRAATLLTNP